VGGGIELVGLIGAHPGGRQCIVHIEGSFGEFCMRARQVGAHLGKARGMSIEPDPLWRGRSCQISRRRPHFPTSFFSVFLFFCFSVFLCEAPSSMPHPKYQNGCQNASRLSEPAIVAVFTEFTPRFRRQFSGNTFLRDTQNIASLGSHGRGTFAFQRPH